MAVTIERACQDDLQALAEINRLSYCRETVAQFAFKDWPDEKNMFEFFKARVSERFEHPATHVFKAVDEATRKISGFICLTLEKGNEAGVGAQNPAADISPTAKIIQQLPPYMDREFVLKSSAEIEEMKSLMKGGEHYCSQLLKSCLDIADQASLPTWLISFPGSHILYLRFGFKDVDYRDTDLGAWDKGKLRGYGVYRQYAMVRS